MEAPTTPQLSEREIERAREASALRRKQQTTWLRAQKLRPFQPTGKKYKSNGARECARRVRQLARAA